MDSLASNQLLRNRSSDEGPTVGDIGRQLWASTMVHHHRHAPGLFCGRLHRVALAKFLPCFRHSFADQQFVEQSVRRPKFDGLAVLAGSRLWPAFRSGARMHRRRRRSPCFSQKRSPRNTSRTTISYPSSIRTAGTRRKCDGTSDSPSKVPSLWKANAYFKKKVRTVYNDPKTGLIILTITFGDPHIAAKWANDLVKLTNAYLRDKAVAESERNIAFLNEEAAKSDVVEVREAVYKIMRERN